MSWNDVPEYPFQGYDKLWQAAGWMVFTSRNSKEEMIYVYACHQKSGRILRININDDVDQNWKRQTIHKLMEIRT